MKLYHMRSVDIYRRRRLGPALFLACLAVAAGCSTGERREGEPRATAPSRIIHVSPRGDDRNPGTATRPVASLARAHEILEEEKPRADVVVKVRSDAGSYLNQSVLWMYCVPGRSVTIEADPPGANAIFEADDDAPRRPFFTLSAARGEPTRVTLRNLTVRKYCGRAVLFLGDAEIRGNWNGSNAIEGCVFEDIGNARLPAKPIAYSAIGLVNSRNNTISNCRFTRIMNHTVANFPQPDRGRDDPSRGIGDDHARLSRLGAGSNPNIPIVGVYLAHYSDSNRIVGCEFSRVKGDPIRIRDDSNHTVIEGNTFELAGWNAVVSTWYCGASRGECYKELEPERPSFGTVFRNNAVEGNWKGGMPRLYDDLASGSETRAADGGRAIVLENNTVAPFR